jgi:hypothetical protein
MVKRLLRVLLLRLLLPAAGAATAAAVATPVSVTITTSSCRLLTAIDGVAADARAIS